MSTLPLSCGKYHFYPIDQLFHFLVIMSSFFIFRNKKVHNKIDLFVAQEAILGRRGPSRNILFIWARVISHF